MNNSRRLDFETAIKLGDACIPAYRYSVACRQRPSGNSIWSTVFRTMQGTPDALSTRGAVRPFNEFQ